MGRARIKINTPVTGGMKPRSNAVLANTASAANSLLSFSVNLMEARGYRHVGIFTREVSDKERTGK